MGFKFALSLSLMITLLSCRHVKNDACGVSAALIPTKGCGQFLLGRSTRSEIEPDKTAEEQHSRAGLFFEFDKNQRLSTIVTTSPNIAEQSGIRVGDSEKSVERKHGKPMIEELRLSKGDVVVGSVGDRALRYEGVEFVIQGGKVWAIRVMRE